MTTITLNKAELKEVKLTKPGKYVINLTKPGAVLKLLGVFNTQGSQTVDIELVINHLVPGTESTVILKGVASDQSKLKIKGLIKIEKNCPRTVSHLTQRVLLLSNEAQAETVPDLEILTDDVVCSHASSISNIDEVQLFYLMSRGLTKTQATDAVVKGFLGGDEH
jgi:Fe-S cluster assembly protein SufD